VKFVANDTTRLLIDTTNYDLTAQGSSDFAVTTGQFRRGSPTLGTTFDFTNSAADGYVTENTSGPIGKLISTTTAIEIGAHTDHPFHLMQNDIRRLTVDVGGNVGISDTSPDAVLDVDSASTGVILRATAETIDAPASGSVSNQALVIETNETGSNDDLAIFRSDADGTPDTEFIFESDGDALADGSFSGGGADYAEYYPTVDPTILMGETVCLDAAHPGSVTHCDAGATDPIGIVSTKPAFVANNYGAEANTADNPRFKAVALAGQVPAFVSAENGAIAVGDPLTASATQTGKVMKATAAGRIVGYALEPASTDSAILVFVNVGYQETPDAHPTVGTDNQASGFGTGGSANFTSLNMDGDVHMQGHNVIDVGEISGLAGAWKIEADGTMKTESSFVAVIESYQGEKVEVPALLGFGNKIVLSGTSTLKNGAASVRFEDVDPAFNDVTSTTAPIQVAAMPVGPAQIYLVSRDHDGFAVQQMNGADSDVQFDWIVTAYRKGFEPVIAEPVEEVPPTEPPAPVQEALAAEEPIVEQGFSEEPVPEVPAEGPASEPQPEAPPAQEAPATP
jgi:hypothetical protein